MGQLQREFLEARGRIGFSAPFGTSTCAGKIAYSASLAIKVRDALRNRSKQGVEAYRCDNCNQWHIGRRSEKVSYAVDPKRRWKAFTKGKERQAEPTVGGDG